MAATKPEPKHGSTPGRKGYRKGCKCNLCRAGQRKYMADYRAKKKTTDAAEELVDVLPDEELSVDRSLDLDWSGPAGLIESTLTEEIEEMEFADPPFASTLIVLAKYDARVLDQIPRIQRLDLISGMQSRLFNVFDRLRKTSGPASNGADAADAFLASLTQDD